MIDEKRLDAWERSALESLDKYIKPTTGIEARMLDDKRSDFKELIRLARIGLSAQGVIKEAVLAIDWDQQDGSCYAIGEDGAELLLMKLGYDWNRGLSNEEVEAFAALKAVSSD